MRLKRLDISNFFSFGEEARVDFEDKAAPILVKGFLDKEEASNGTGKSSLFEALYWCLCGKTVRGVQAADVIRLGQRACKVVAQFSHAGREYVVERLYSQAKKSIVITTDDEREEFHETRQGTKRLFELLGITDEILALACFYGRNFITFSRMPPRDRANLIDNLAGGRRWEAARERARQRSREAARSYMRHHSAAVNAEKKAEEHERKAACATEELSTLEAQERARQKALKDDIRNLQKQRRNAEKEMALLGSQADLSVPETEALDEKVQGLQERIRALEEKEDAAQDRMRDAASTLSELDRNCKSRRQTLKRLKETEKTGNCQECGQPLPEDPDQKAKRKADIDALEKQLRRDGKAKEKAEGEREAAEHEAVALENQIDECREAIDSAEGERRLVLSGFKARQKDEQRKESKRVEIRKAIADIDKTLAAREKDLALVESGGPEKGGISTSIDLHKEEAQKLRKEQKKEWKKAEQCEADRAICAYWEQGFKSIRFDVFEGTIQALQRLVEVRCRQQGLEFDRVEISSRRVMAGGQEKPQINLYLHRGANRLNLDGLSEGETQRVNLAFFFAMGTLLEQRRGREFSLRVLDEPLTGVDADGKERIFQLISQMSTNRQVVVMDHDANFQSLFESHITVVKEGGVSRIEES